MSLINFSNNGVPCVANIIQSKEKIEELATELTGSENPYISELIEVSMEEVDEIPGNDFVIYEVKPSKESEDFWYFAVQNN